MRNTAVAHRAASYPRKTTREIMEMLSGLNAERGITVIMVTHEADMAAYAHRVVRFHDGRIASDEVDRHEGSTPEVGP